MTATAHVEEAPKVQGMTRSIGVAKKSYGEDSGASIYPGFRDIIQSLIEEGYTKSIPIESYTDALFITELIFKHTHRNLRMLSGRDGDGFLSTLRPTFIQMLERLKKSNGTARVILLRGEDSAKPDMVSMAELMKQFPGVLEIVTGVIESPVEHFSVADGRMIRIEELHPELNDEMPENVIHAEVYFCAPDRSRFYEEKFNNFWKLLH